MEGSHLFFKKNLKRGTKQEDPLSPLLFTLFLEPLAATIKSQRDIEGVVQGTEEYKMFLYADDILLLIRDPSSSIPKILSTIETFSKISGHKINWPKSEAMPVSKGCYQVSPFQFRWIPTWMKYLDIRLFSDLTNTISVIKVHYISVNLMDVVLVVHSGQCDYTQETI